MFFIPLLLFLTINSIDATLPDFPDVNSFMPTILEMVPINGQLRVNDQIFNFGSTTTPSSDISAENTEEPRVEAQQTPNTRLQAPDFETRAADNLSPLPNVEALPTQPQSNGQNQQSFDSRAQNELPKPIADSFPQSFSTNPTNFDVRIPSLDSILSNLRTQNSFANTLPNIGSTEIGSTFARNANSDFRDEFSEPTASTPVPFGFPGPGAGNDVRSNLVSTESPLVVMPLVVSPDRLLQRNGLSSNPLPIPSLFAENERMSASERVESFPVAVETLFKERKSNESTDSSSQVMSRHSTIVVPPATFRELTNESLPSEHNFDEQLDRHVMKILRNFNATQRSDGSPLLKLEMPSKKSQSTQESTQTPKSSEETIV